MAKKPKGSSSGSSPFLAQIANVVSVADALGDSKPIGMVPLQVTGCRCRCGHEWLPQGSEKPRVCPKCKSPHWDLPRRWTKKKRVAEGE